MHNSLSVGANEHFIWEKGANLPFLDKEVHENAYRDVHIIELRTVSRSFWLTVGNSLECFWKIEKNNFLDKI